MYQNATVCVEIKRGKENTFSVTVYTLRQTLCVLLPLAFSTLPSLLIVMYLNLEVILHPPYVQTNRPQTGHPDSFPQSLKANDGIP